MNANGKLVIKSLLEEGASDEAIAYALAQSIHTIIGPEALLFRLSQADNIRENLRSLGFIIIPLPWS